MKFPFDLTLKVPGLVQKDILQTITTKTLSLYTQLAAKPLSKVLTIRIVWLLIQKKGPSKNISTQQNTASTTLDLQNSSFQHRLPFPQNLFHKTE